MHWYLHSTGFPNTDLLHPSALLADQRTPCAERRVLRPDQLRLADVATDHNFFHFFGH